MLPLNPGAKEFQIPTEGNVNGPSTTSPSSLHVGTGGRVALETARAVVRGKGKPCGVRVLFDAGSHRSFITSRAAQRAQLAVIRQDWLGISTFGQRSRDTRLRDVVKIKVSPVGGQKGITMEAYVVPEISSIQNSHIELAKREYPHLKGLWFSDVCKGQEELEIDVLIGADYLWNFQRDSTIRGEPNEPVAVETELKWVLSGPMKGQPGAHTTQVNFIKSSADDKVSLEGEVHKLWDLETIGIKGSGDEVQDEFRDISCDGERYSVKLP